jgi:phage I-like protein
VIATAVRAQGCAVDLSAKDGTQLPRRMKVLNWGENANARNKRVFVGPKLVRALGAPTDGFRKIALDFEHNTAPGTPAYLESREPRPVAGFASVECVEGQGVFLAMQAWTPDGLANAANYCDLSALAVCDPDGEVYAIPSAALCRCGAVEGMDFAEIPLNVPANPAEVQPMDWKTMIAKALGMDPATVTDDDLAKALAEALKKPDATALNAAVETATEPFKTTVAALSATLEGIKQSIVDRDKADVLAGALRSGKVVALNAEAVAKLSVDDLRKHVEALQVTVPLSARTPEALVEDATKREVTAERRAIALNCGLEPEKVFPTAK